MSKGYKKRERQQAIGAELARRLTDRRSRCPLTLEQLLSLHTHVAHQVDTKGHNSDFHFTHQWLSASGLDVPAMIAFLNTQKVEDDWDLVVMSDPYETLGGTKTRRRFMPLERDELEDLLDWLAVRVREVGCQHDHRLTTEWLMGRSVDPGVTRIALLAQGGGCDCEVVLNVDPDAIYP